MKAMLPMSLDPSPRAIWLEGDQLYVGTKGAEIFQMSYGAQVGAPAKITEGHYEPNTKCLNEAWGLDIMEQADGQTTVVSCSDDGTLRTWNPETHQLSEMI